MNEGVKVNHRLLELINRKEIELGRRLTITEVAAEAGVSRQMLYTWMNVGIGNVRADTIAKLCIYFDCEVGDLLYLDKIA